MDYAPPPSHYESVVYSAEDIKRQAFAYMRELQGWCSENKAGVLIDLVLERKPSVIVEIGVFGGKSLVPMAYALKINGSGKAYGIDPWSTVESLKEMKSPKNKKWWKKLDHESILLGLQQKIEQFALGKQITLIQNTSEGADPISEIDMLHIDGNHSEKTSYFDVTKWVPLVKKGGLIIFDDMTWAEKGKITTGKAVAWLNENCTPIAEFTDSCTWGIWEK